MFSVLTLLINRCLFAFDLYKEILLPFTCSIFFFFGAAAQRGLWPPHSRDFSRSHTTDAAHSVGLLWTSDQLVAETST